MDSAPGGVGSSVQHHKDLAWPSVRDTAQRQVVGAAPHWVVGPAQRLVRNPVRRQLMGAAQRPVRDSVQTQGFLFLQALARL